VVDYEVPGTEADRRAQLSVLDPADPSQDPYFLLTLPPPAVLMKGSGLPTEPVDVVFCLDISGSTRGRKLNALQEALRDALSDLSPGDRFAVMAFDDDARLFRKHLSSAGPREVAAAIRFVNRQRVGAGSDARTALRVALNVLGRGVTARGSVVVMLVDQEDCAGVAASAARLKLPNAARLTVVGALPDARLIHNRLVGESLKPGPSVSLSRATFTHGPSLVGASWDPGSLNASYVYPLPDRLPQLALSSPVMLLGRLNEPPPLTGTVSLKGRVEGKVRTLTVDYRLQSLPPGSPLPALWANRRLHRLRELVERATDPTEISGAMDEVRKEHHLAVSASE
jgi:Ca-activated chloride channel homolog